MVNKAGMRGATGAATTNGAPASTPPSGVRSTPARVSGPPPLPVAETLKVRAMSPSGAVLLTADVPGLEIDPAERTRVKPPNPSLLALSRGVSTRGPRRSVWFALGAVVGATLVWLAIGDVRSDVYSARLWTANALRSLRGLPARSEPARDADPAASATTTGAAAPLRVDSAAPRGASPSSIPTVDVSQLPAAGSASAAKGSAAGDPTHAPASTGAPSLPHAPGPR